MTNSRKEISFSGHTHSNYALTTHTHSNYALTNHTHTGYAASNHTHSQYMTEAQVQALIEESSGTQKKIITLTENDFVFFEDGIRYYQYYKNLNTLCQFTPDNGTFYMDGFYCKVRAGSTISSINNKEYILQYRTFVDMDIANYSDIHSLVNCIARIDLNYTDSSDRPYYLWLWASMGSSYIRLDLCAMYDNNPDEYQSTWQWTKSIWVDEVIDFSGQMLFLGPTTA